MSCGLPREVLKWILSLDLSYAVKNPKRDFANGFLYAEILSRYYPADVQMHSFENVASMERKKSNWALLEKVIKRKRIPIERGQIEAVMAAEGDAAVEVLQTVFSFIHSPSYEASKVGGGQPPPAASPGRSAAAVARDRGHDASTSDQADFVPFPVQSDQQPQQYGQLPGAMYFGGGGGGLGGGSPATYQNVAMGLQQQQYQLQQLQQQHQHQLNGYGGYAQAQQSPTQYSERGPGVAGPGGGYGYGYPSPEPTGMGVGGSYAAQMQHQQHQQQHQQPSVRSISPGWSSGARPQPQQQQQPSAAAVMPVAAGGGYAAAYALAYAEQMRQQAVAAGYSPDQQQLVYQQALYQYQQQQQQQQVMAAAAAAATGITAAAATGGTPSGAAQGVSPERQGLPYSRKPRPVEFKPYDIKDFEDKEYNVKAGRGYWQLGKLGPDLETEELQAKREAKERIKKIAEQVRGENARRANSRPRQRSASADTAAGAGAGAGPGGSGGAASGGLSSPAPREGKEKELSARERALQFAKNIPRPEPKPKKQLAASQSGEAVEEGAPVLSELELLEKQHQERQQQVDKIRAELARIL